MKFLLVVVVVGVVLWLMFGRNRIAGRGSTGGRGQKPDIAPATIVSCSRCGLHLPQLEASLDASGRFYCSDAHRAAGPGPGPAA